MKNQNVTMISAWASRAGGGLQSSVRDLALALQAHVGCKVQFVSNQDSHTPTDSALWAPISPRLHRYFGPEQFRFSPGLMADVCMTKTDIIQLHGIWMFPGLAIRMRRLLRQTPLIISPHGMLDPWILSRGRWKKSMAMAVYETSNWRAALALRALNAAEADAISKVMPGCRIEVIPNGVYTPSREALVEAETRRTARGLRQFLFLGRLHEKKGVLELLQAWRNVEGAVRRHGAELVIAGWGDGGYPGQVQESVERTPGARFVGAVFGAAKEQLLWDSTDFLLPSHSEGLPVAVLEACAYGLLPIISEQCNLPELATAGISQRADPDVQSIGAALLRALDIQEPERRQIGSAAQEHVRQRYAWEAIAATFEQLHRLIVLK